MVNVVDGSQINILVNHNSLIHKEKQAASEAKAKVDEKALCKAAVLGSPERLLACLLYTFEAADELTRSDRWRA